MLDGGWADGGELDSIAKDDDVVAGEELLGFSEKGLHELLIHPVGAGDDDDIAGLDLEDGRRNVAAG
jgi:hypothetical protein